METAKRFWFFFLVILFSVPGGWSAVQATEVTYTGPPITIRYSSHVPESHMVVQRSLLPWMKLVERESAGKLVMKTYFNGVLHGSRDGFKACLADITDMTHGYPRWQSGSFNLPHVLDLPFAFPNVYVSSFASEKLYPKYFKKEYEKMGVYLANYQTTTPYNILSKKAVRKLEDLKGMKIAGTGGVVNEILKHLGAAPTVVSTADMYTAFQRGMVDAILLYDNGFVSFRLYEVAKYRIPLGLNLASTPYCLNRKTIDGLPKDLKKVFYNSQRVLDQMAAEGYDYADNLALTIMQKAGIETIHLPAAELARFKAAVEPLWEEFATKNEALGLPARQLTKDLRALSGKYSTWTPEQLMKEVRENPIPGIIEGM